MNDLASFNPARPLRALALSYFAMGASSLAVVGAIGFIARGVEVETHSIALLVSVYAIVFAVAAPLLQVFSANVPRRTLILVGLVLSAAGAVGSALATSYVLLLAARVVAALGAAAIGPVASALGASLVLREHQGRAMATVFVGMTLASVVSTPAAEWFAGRFGWRAMFIGIAALNVAVAVAVAAWVQDRTAAEPLSLRALIGELRRPALGSGVGVMFLYMAGLFVSFTLIVPILEQRFELTSRSVSMALLTFGLAGIAGNTLVKRLASHHSADRLVAQSLLVLIGVFALLYVAPAHTFVAVGLLAVWACCNDVFMPSQQRRLAEIAPQARGLALALNASALYLGMSAGSLLASKLAAFAGVGALPAASAVILACALASLAWSRASHARLVVSS
jgi:MFS transporter, DHA1 family, inner membrane transport protein